MGTLLSLLIKNNDLPETTNRLVAYYILYDIFRNDGDPDASPKESPFKYFLFSLVESKESIYKLNSIEKNFIVQLLSSGTKDVRVKKLFYKLLLTLLSFKLSKQTPHHIRQTEQMPMPNIDMTQIRKYCMEKEKELPASTKSCIMNLVPAPLYGLRLTFSSNF